MSQKNRNLIEKSIEHWYDNLNAACAGEYNDMHIGPSKCALCEEYQGDCFGCPVYNSTKRESCFSTPYVEVFKKLSDIQNRLGESQEELIEDVVDEIHFLESLLDKE